MNKLQHLTKFTLISTNSFLLKKEFFITLKNFCPDLEFVSLQYCNIKELVPILTLKELELKYCNGLSWNDFKTILSEMSLQKFTSDATRYPGTFENFSIAPTLEHINLQYNIVNNIKTLFSMNQENLKNLKTLNWSVDYAKHSWINATNCPILEILIVKPRNILFNNLHGFVALKSLVLNVNNDLTDLDIVQILKHSTLSSFTLNATNYNWLIDTYEYNGSYETEWSNIKTSLLHINLYYHKSLSALLHNWLNLLKCNKNLSLKLKFHYFEQIEDTRQALIDILSNPRFPQHIKSINVCAKIISK